MALLNGVELPALEDGCVNKKLLVSFVRSPSIPRAYCSAVGQSR